MPKNALMILADGFEEIEAFSVFDILERAGVKVTLAGLSAKEIRSARAAKILAEKLLENNDTSYDAVIFPGGAEGARNLADSEKVKNILKEFRENKKIIAAICASPAVVLEPLGILKGKKATAYPGMLKEALDEPVVVDGNIVTSQGPGTAHLFGLKLAELLTGEERARSVKKAMLL